MQVFVWLWAQSGADLWADFTRSPPILNKVPCILTLSAGIERLLSDRNGPEAVGSPEQITALRALSPLCYRSEEGAETQLKSLRFWLPGTDSNCRPTD
jgi:hypothetical protein